MRRVRRADGSTAPLLHGEVEAELAGALIASTEAPPSLARALADAVMELVQKGPLRDLSEPEYEDLLANVLESTGHEAAARHLVHERRERAALLGHLEVQGVDGRGPFCHERFVQALVRNAGLPDVIAGEIALRVERQLAALRVELVSSGLLAELAASALLALDGSSARAAVSVALSPRDLGARLGSAGGDPQLADRLLAAAAFEKLLPLEVHSGAVAAAVMAGDITLPGLGDPLRAGSVDVGTVPSSPLCLAATISRLLPLVRGTLALTGVARLHSTAGDAVLEAASEAVRLARRAGCSARVALDLPLEAALLETTRHWRRDFGIDVLWRVDGTTSDTLVMEQASAGAAFLLREGSAPLALGLVEVGIDLLQLFQSVHSVDAADVAMVRARSLVSEVEAERSRIQQSTFLAAVLDELGLPSRELAERTRIRLLHLGEALDLLVHRGALRAQERPRLAARLVACLLDVDPASSGRRFEILFSAAAPPGVVSRVPDAVLPLGWPLDAPIHRGLLSKELTAALGGVVPLPFAITSDRGARAVLDGLLANTALRCVRFVVPDAAAEEVQGDLFQAPSPR